MIRTNPEKFLLKILKFSIFAFFGVALLNYYREDGRTIYTAFFSIFGVMLCVYPIKKIFAFPFKIILFPIILIIKLFDSDGSFLEGGEYAIDNICPYLCGFAILKLIIDFFGKEIAFSFAVLSMIILLSIVAFCIFFIYKTLQGRG